MAREGLPRVTAGLAGSVLESLPARLRRRLDAEPAMAESWDWTVAPDLVAVAQGEATVTLRPSDGLVSAPAQVGCTCLLAPACLHISAVLIRLEVDEGTGEGVQEAAASASSEPLAGQAAPSAVGEPMMAAAAQMASAVGRILEVGAASAGVVATGEVLRAVHSSQVAGLHRIAAAGLRVARGLGRLQADEPEFRLHDLRVDIAEALGTSRRVLSGQGTADVVGTARRAYESAGSLRLFGLLTEPIVSRSGYAGCVTYMVDRELRIWALSDVMPGEPGRAREAYGSGTGIGDVSLSHRETGRSGAHIGEARASADRRLGRGQQVRAVRAEGVAWTEEPIAGLFTVPLLDQLARALAAYDLPDTLRPQGSNLVFARAVVLGERRGRLWIALDGLPVDCVPPLEDPELSFRENMRVLAGAPGAELMIVGRVTPDAPATIALLAVGAAAGGSLDLPAGWAGRVNLGFDNLARSQVRPAAVPAVATTGSTLPDVLDPLRRRLDRLVLGGRLVMGDAARPGVDREISVLRRRHLPTGAAVLGALAATAASRSGTRELADAWLAASTYEMAAERRLSTRRWFAGRP